MTNKNNKQYNRINSFLKYMAGIFASIGVAAIIYKLYVFGLTKENIADASINLAQILTSVGILFSFLFTIKIKLPEGYLRKNLDKWNRKYGILNNVADSEEEKANGKKVIWCQMLRDHSNILKKVDGLGPKAYVNFARIPTEDLAGEQILFLMPTSIFRKVGDRKELKKYAKDIVEKLKSEYSDIVNEKKSCVGDRESTDTIYLHIYLRKDLEDDKETVNQILDLLDYMTMVFLAIA